MCVLSSEIANLKNSGIFALKILETIDKGNTLRNTKIWLAMQDNGVPDTYYFDNQTVPGTNYNNLLHSCVRAQAPNFPSNTYFL